MPSSAVTCRPSPNAMKILEPSVSWYCIPVSDRRADTVLCFIPAYQSRRPAEPLSVLKQIIKVKFGITDRSRPCVMTACLSLELCWRCSKNKGLQLQLFWGLTACRPWFSTLQYVPLM
eukprot:scaffold31462_cov20-Prasinocladus_malaysianus.AAC.1